MKANSKMYSKTYKQMSKRIYLTIYIFFFTILLNAQIKENSKKSIPLDKISTYTQAQACYTQAHEAFVGAEYNLAIACYKKVDGYISAHPEHSSFFDHSYRNYSMVDMVRRRQTIGEMQPKWTHRVLVIFINKVSASYKGNRVKTVMTDDIKKKAETAWGVCSRLTEVLSAGELTLNFDAVNLNSTLTCVEEPEGGDGLQSADRFIYSLTPYPTKLLSSKLNDYDSFLFIWNPKDSYGNTSYKGAHGWGGVSRISLSPYMIEGPMRGRLVISASLINRPGTILHELFHTMEKCYDISPIHGFRDENRGHFPRWKGRGEINYYQYHYTEIMKKEGFLNLSLSKLFPLQPALVELAKQSQSGVTASLNNRKKARGIARKISGNYSQENEKLYKDALLLNPYDPEILLQYTISLHSAGRKSEALDQIKSAYHQSPYNPEICYWIGVESYHGGKKKAAISYMKEALVLDKKMQKAEKYLDFMQGKN